MFEETPVVEAGEPPHKKHKSSKKDKRDKERNSLFMTNEQKDV